MSTRSMFRSLLALIFAMAIVGCKEEAAAPSTTSTATLPQGAGGKAGKEGGRPGPPAPPPIAPVK